MKEYEHKDNQGFPDESLADASQANKLEKLARFELLSAYMDGEATAEEKLLVHHWLDTDPKFKQLYLQLLRLQQDVQHIPTPTYDADLIATKVFAKIDRKRHRTLILTGSGLIAAIFLAIAYLLLPERHGTQIAYQNPAISPYDSEPLIITLNHPILDIPEVEKQKSKGVESNW